MRESETRTINGKTYVFFQFPATKGVKVWLKLVKILGNPLTLLVQNIAKGSSGKGIKGALEKELGSFLADISLETVVADLLERVDVEDTTGIIMDLMSSVSYEGKPLNEIFDIHFKGSYMSLCKVIAAALEVQYSDFLGELKDQIGLKVVGTTQEKLT